MQYFDRAYTGSPVSCKQSRGRPVTYKSQWLERVVEVEFLGSITSDKLFLMKLVSVDTALKALYNTYFVRLCLIL